MAGYFKWLLFFLFGSLRVIAGVLLLLWAIVFVGAFSRMFDWDSKPQVASNPLVCGKISGRVFEFSRAYVPFWPEYEGKSSFTPGFIHNKTGCDANLVSVMLSVNWPDMTPAPDRWVFQYGLRHPGLLVTLKPVITRPGHMEFVLKQYLSGTPGDVVRSATFDVEAGLYKVEGVDRVVVDNKIMFAWSKKSGVVDAAGFCSREKPTGIYFACRMTYVASGGVLVQVIFLPEKFKHWPEIRATVNDFLSAIEKDI